ncbi:MAG: aldo/keto reductase [Candidatus Omnitrophica bacterium]|nr:aldo/keto reductase [Candidatus Omnitrophota bacterium]
MLKKENIYRRIALGTVQFGQVYGVANQRGQVQRSEVFDILKYAQEQGIELLDTASAYGESENVLGEFLAQEKNAFQIVSKLPANSQANASFVQQSILDSLHQLNVSRLYGYLIHQFEDFEKCPDVVSASLQKLKEEKRVEKIGFSLYHPSELEFLWKHGVPFDLLQIPYSILDQRFELYLKDLKKSGTEVHARSLFLQGAVFLDPKDLKGNLQKAQTQIQQLHDFSSREKLSIQAMCLNFVLLNPCIDKVIIGVDGLDQLKKNLNDVLSISMVEKTYPSLLKLRIDDERIVVPKNWN